MVVSCVAGPPVASTFHSCGVPEESGRTKTNSVETGCQAGEVSAGPAVSCSCGEANQIECSLVSAAGFASVRTYAMRPDADTAMSVGVTTDA